MGSNSTAVGSRSEGSASSCARREESASRPSAHGISCERLHIGVVDSTEPPHLGVPDEVWASLFYASGSLAYAGPAIR